MNREEKMLEMRLQNNLPVCEILLSTRYVMDRA